MARLGTWLHKRRLLALRSAPARRSLIVLLLGTALPGLLSAAVAAMLPGCAVDNRLGPTLGQALVDGPVRSYASQQALAVAREALSLAEAARSDAGAPRDLPSARAGWVATRLAYDRGAAFFFVAAPDLNQALDGRFDDPLATTGLRRLEPILYSAQPIDANQLEYLGRNLASAGVALAGAMPDPARAVGLAGLLGSMSAQAAVVGTKLDGSDSPYAAVSHRSIEQNLIGLQAMYLALSPAVQNADAALHDQISALFVRLLMQVQGQPSVDTVRNKVGFLRDCDALSTALLSIGNALGLTVSAPVDVT